LLLVGSPTAIGWLVVAIVVDAIKAVACSWMLAHVTREVLEAHEVAAMPAPTDSDAATAVTMKAMVVRVKAPIVHSQPSAIESAFLAAPRMTVTHFHQW
jgi:hypothetical protein